MSRVLDGKILSPGEVKQVWRSEGGLVPGIKDGLVVCFVIFTNAGLEERLQALDKRISSAAQRYEVVDVVMSVE